MLQTFKINRFNKPGLTASHKSNRWLGKRHFAKSAEVGSCCVGNHWKYWRPIYSYTWALIQRSSYRHFCDFTNKRKGNLIFDIGTGTGEYIRHLGKDNRYIFNDLDEQSLNSAQKKAEKYLPSGQWRALPGDAIKVIETIPEVDIISMIHVISVVVNPTQLINTAIERLKPGGTLIIYISRFSAKAKLFCNSFTRLFGFRLLDVGAFLPKFKRERAGLLNHCYVVEKT